MQASQTDPAIPRPGPVVTNGQTVGVGAGSSSGVPNGWVATADAGAADHPGDVVVARRIQEQNESVLVAGFDSGGTPVMAAEVIGGDPVTQDLVISTLVVACPWRS